MTHRATTFSFVALSVLLPFTACTTTGKTESRQPALVSEDESKTLWQFNTQG